MTIMIRNFRNPFFIDIETVSSTPHYEDLSPQMQKLWTKKAKQFGAQTPEEVAESFAARGAIFAEFGKVVVIACGWVVAGDQAQPILQVKGLASHDEAKLLQAFKDLLTHFPQSNLQLCGHNGKEFDFPYLSRRMTIHGILLPKALDMTGKKPWEVNHIDTMELWKFGDRKSYTSLDLLATLFGIPSSKDAMEGSEVGDYYYIKKDLKAIEQYCMDDVVATVQVYRKLRNLPLLPESSITRYPSLP